MVTQTWLDRPKATQATFMWSSLYIAILEVELLNGSG
jgi:hypothetical protein